MKNLKQLRLRIKVIADIKKTTKAMQLIAASKLQHLKIALEPSDLSFLSSFDTLETCLTLYKYFEIQPKTYIENLLLDSHNNIPEKKLILFIATDQGLCGTYNNNLFKFINSKLRLPNNNVKDNVELFTYGKKATEFALRNFNNIPQEHFVTKSKDLRTNTCELSEQILNKFIIILYNI